MNMMTSYTKIQTLFAYNTLLKNAFTKATTINITRHMARRDKLYGVEEGHAEQKNEVRKEKYWRKRNPSMKGLHWRESQGYDKSDALCKGAFALIPDWSDESGDVGAPTILQQNIMHSNLRLVNEVYEAAAIVRKAQEFEPSSSKASESIHSEPKTN